MLKWLGCNCAWKAFVVSTCKLGVIVQIVGGSLVAFAIGCGLYAIRYNWLLRQVAEAEIDRALKKAR